MAKTRAERTDHFYQRCIRELLISLLKIINPGDELEWGKLKYPGLLKYTIDWLETELREVTGQVDPSPGLALED